MNQSVVKNGREAWTNECVAKHPKNALEAWQATLEFNGTNNFADDWKHAQIFLGLQGGVRNSNDGRFDPTKLQPESIRDQYSIGTVVKELASEKKAQEQACVAVYDPNSDKKTVQDANTKCQNHRQCYTIDQKGNLTQAMNVAKQRFEKNKKGQVVPGFCMGRGTAAMSNIKNKHEFSTLAQQEATIIREQDKEMLNLRGIDKPYDGCDKR